MGHFSRNKGKVGERELARELSRVFGITARRGVQFSGGPDSPDVVTNIPDIHFECKRAERLRLYDAIEQAVSDSGESKVPVVMHRQNKKPWVAIVRLDDLPRLANILVQYQTTNDINNTQQPCQPQLIPNKSESTLAPNPGSP